MNLSRIERIESLMFSIEMEGLEATEERWKTLQKRSDRLDDIAVREFGHIIISE